jgi:peptidoglycan hydrolase-like protein with peptidoglycan-binding domain
MLRSQLFSQNARLNQAATNSPPMRRGERDTVAVALLQQALRDLNIATMRRSINADGTFDGDYAGETFHAVRKFQEDTGLTNGRSHGDGIVGADTIGALDFLSAAQGLTPVIPLPPSRVTRAVETQSTLPVGDPRIPSAARLRQEYGRFVDSGGRPCNATRSDGPITNQCAIRLSIALGRADIGFHMRAAPGVTLFVHRAGSQNCGGHIEVPHDARAQRIYNHISSFSNWNFTTYRINAHQSGADVYDTLNPNGPNGRGTPGIVFFDNIGTSTATAGGDHIDFFDGRRIMNDELNYSAPGEPRGRNPNTTFADTRTAIYFLPIHP